MLSAIRRYKDDHKEQSDLGSQEIEDKDGKHSTSVITSKQYDEETR